MPSFVDGITNWANLIIIIGAVLAIIAPPSRRILRDFLGVKEAAVPAETVNMWEPFENIGELRDHIVDQFREFKEEIRGDIAEVKTELDRVEALETAIQNGISDRMNAVEEKVTRLLEGQARMEGRLERRD